MFICPFYYNFFVSTVALLSSGTQRQKDARNNMDGSLRSPTKNELKVIKNYFVPEPSPYVSIGDSLTTYAIYNADSRDVDV